MSKHLILFHGRHLLHTRFQEAYVTELVARLSQQTTEPIEVVFAITSANHANSRYNPVSFHHRAIGIDRFGTSVLAPLGVGWSIVPVPHLRPTDHFVRRILTYVRALHELTLTPEETVVLCSTPALISQFRAEGYDVVTAEYDEKGETFIAPTPQTLLTTHAATLTNWEQVPILRNELADSTRSLWRTYTEIPREIERLWNETLLTEQGDITDTRDYDTYAFSMSRTEVIDYKYADIRPGIVPGVIVDEGCADGALLARIAREFPDSDLVGIEITREFIAQAHERQRRGDFGQSFAFFYQRNLGTRIFPDDSIDTTICNSTTHEIWSYAGEDAGLRQYLAFKYAQLKPGGTLLIRDVIGPEEGDEMVYVVFSETDGVTVSPEEASGIPAAELSTLSRFYRFAHEFYNDRGIAYTEQTIDGTRYIVLSRRDAANYLLKKDYTDSWESELHEDFAHWSFSRWKEELAASGFVVDDALSRSYTNPWIVEHHFANTAALYRKEGEALVPEPFPPTNVVLVAHK